MEAFVTRIQFNIIHRLAVQHAVADYLCQLESGELGLGVHDDFSDVQLFRVEAVNSLEVDEDLA